MQVKDIMCADVKTCKADTPIKDIATLMCLNKFSGLPVVDDDNNLIGIISEKDILSSMFPDMKEIIESGAKADFEEMENQYTSVLDNTADDLMTRSVASVPSDMPILRAASTMWLRKFRRIPVTENKKLVGIISLGDVHKSVFQNSLLINKS